MATQTTIDGTVAAPGEPRFRVFSKEYPVSECVILLNKMKVEAEAKDPESYWVWLEVTTIDVGGVRTPKLKCLRCGELRTCSNPSQTGIEHLKGVKGNPPACKALKAAAKLAAKQGQLALGKRELGASAEGNEGSTSGSVRGSKQTRLDGFVASGESIRQARESLGRFFYKNNVALQLIEDPDLVAAFLALGAHLPSRDMLSNSMLTAEYQRVRDVVLADLKKHTMVSIATDGWRKDELAVCYGCAGPPAAGRRAYRLYRKNIFAIKQPGKGRNGRERVCIALRRGTGRDEVGGWGFGPPQQKWVLFYGLPTDSTGVDLRIYASTRRSTRRGCKNLRFSACLVLAVPACTSKHGGGGVGRRIRPTQGINVCWTLSRPSTRRTGTWRKSRPGAPGTLRTRSAWRSCRHRTTT
jgi:hypothetical protein